MNKLESAVSILQESKIDIDLAEALKKLGVTEDTDLKYLTWEDLEKLGIPLVKARKIVDIFRSDQKPKTSLAAIVKEVKPASLRTLLDVYDPLNPGRTHDRLKALVKNNPCIVFTDNGSVDVESSFFFCQEAANHGVQFESAVVGGKTRKLYKIGERPASKRHRNPAFPSYCLLGDGTCHVTGLGWSSVSDDIKKLILIAASNGEFVSTPNNAVDLISQIVSGKFGFDELSIRYPKAAVELEQTGGPSLTVLTSNGSKPSSTNIKQNPFS